ncbi:MAG: hypothetical protein RLZ84_1313 [Actinomycetota bacterium]
MSEPVWLVSAGRVLAAAQRPHTRAQRRRGLIGQVEFEPLVLQPCRWVHSLGMRVTIEVAYLDVDGQVVFIERLRPWRVAAPVWRARSVIEASIGSFERWNLNVGDVVEVRHGIN